MNRKHQISRSSKHSQKLKAELKKHGEALHRKINIIIHSKQAEIDDMDNKHQAALDKQENAINSTIHEMKQVIRDLKSLLDTCNIYLVSKYQSRMEEFRKPPPKLNISIPIFHPVKINREQILNKFGFLTALSMETEEQGYTMPSLGTETSPTDRALLDAPQLMTEVHTGHELLYEVSCLSDDEIWTCRDNKTLKLYNLKGELLKSVTTKSGNNPEDIAVTRSRDLVYTDYWDRSINLVSGKQIQTLIILQGWRPHNLCGTSSGDLLVIMTSDDVKQTKVVRYSGSTEKQSIQWDNQGKPFYTSGHYIYS